jgi:DNA ligase (NAD+)
VVLKPIRIGGVTVTHATLSNFKLVKKLDIAIGDKVRVTRRGGVIPKVEHRVAEGENRRPIPVPTKCPSCESTLVEKGANLFCRNEQCKGRLFRRLLSYVEKRNIKWLGEEVLHELFENHGIKEPADIYKITEEQLAKVKRGIGIVGAGAKQIIEEIEKSRNSTLNDFIGSLGIEFLGRRQAEIMMDQGIDKLERFVAVTVDALTKLTGFSEEGTKAPAIVEGIRKAKSMIDDLAKCVRIVEPKPKPKPAAGGKLAGKSFVVTGKIQRLNGPKPFTRNEIHQIILNAGGTVSEEIKKGVILVQCDPDSTSSKTKKAQKLGVPVISEDDIWGMLG